MQHKQQLYLIRGVLGSGKTTLANAIRAELAKDGQAVYRVEADQFFTSVRNGVDHYRFDRRFIGAAHDLCYGRTMKYLMDGCSVVVANTFVTAREIDRYVKGVQRSELDVPVTVVKCTDTFQTRPAKPRRLIERMLKRWEDYPGEIEYSAKRNAQ